MVCQETWLEYQASLAPAVDHPFLQRLPQDRRRLQPPLHLLHHPRHPGSVPKPPLDSILTEAAQLVAQGVIELNLVAQDTTAYGLTRAARRNCRPC